MATLTSLPPELIACILDFVPSIDLQQTTISLLHILSYAFVLDWRRSLFYHVHLKSPESVIKLFEHLQRIPSDAILVQKFSLATWTVDAEVAVNLILALPNLRWLSLCMGASFFPEDMEKLFRETMPNLRYLFFQHRPLSLMESDRWYDFLDGSDFHSVLEILARWPTSDILAVSVVMDLPDPSRFEHLDWEQAEFLNLLDILDLPLFLHSPLLERTRALRMRYLWCNIAYTLYLNQPLIPSLPPLTFLDLSTSTVSVADVHFLLRNLRWLRHLILDGCGILDKAPIEGWAGFGHDCLMIDSGSRLEDEMMSASTSPIEGSPSGVSILPWSSELRTLALSAPLHTDADIQRALISAFQRGWGAAVIEFNDRLHAVRQSRLKGVQTLRFAYPGEARDPTDRMMVVNDDEFARFNKFVDDNNCPVVCLAGQAGREGALEHSESCAHSIGWDIWEDTL